LPSPGDLERLARKYRTLGDLRRARARGESVPPRSVFKDLAGEFPGALNELDTLPLEEIDRRAERIEEAIAGAPIEPWIAWLHGYHALLRAALAIKPLASRAGELEQPRARELALRGASRAAPGGAAGTWAALIDEDFVRAVARPPGGRINTVVFDRLSTVFGEPAAILHRALFPALRSRIR
jgi:hypothetical protein